MKNRKKLTLVVAIALPLFLSPNFARSETCRITRTLSRCPATGSCAEVARADFARYAREQSACGVLPQCEPTIYPANPAAGAPKGTIVLVHGLTANPAHMADIAKRMQADGYNVVLPILMGHGGEDNLLTRASLPEWKRDVAFAGQIAQRLGGPLHIIGHSTGGVMAALESAANPGRYSSVVGLDPALNLEGQLGRTFDNICLGRNFWDFPRDIPLMLQKPDEIVHIPDVADCRLPRSASADLVRQVEELRIGTIVRKFCGDTFAIPHYNYEFSLQALCALKQATAEMNASKVARLPPSLLILSSDDTVFGYISREKIERAVGRREQNAIIHSEAPFHGLMVAACSPGFDNSITNIRAWLASHRN